MSDWGCLLLGLNGHRAASQTQNFDPNSSLNLIKSHLFSYLKTMHECSEFDAW